VRFTASGGSMAPCIRHHDIIVVAPLGDRPIQAGEIVLVDSEGEGLMVHRVLELRGKGSRTRIITGGDASRVADRPVIPGDVLGRLVRIEAVWDG